MVPRGLSFNAVSAKALAAMKTAKLARGYWDWAPLATANETGFFPYTPAVNLLFALEAAIEGASARVWQRAGGWRPFVRVLTTPELWVAAQIRKRAATMAWTPGLTLDYARALSMLADPRPSGWGKMARLALQRMYRSRQQWREEEKAAGEGRSPKPADTAGGEI